jgi:hypothetical protein
MSFQALPYMKPVSKVAGLGSTQPTLFGVLGMFAKDEHFAGLQKQVMHKSHGMLPPLYSGEPTHHHNTDRDLLGPASKTHIPGIHYGMVPFAGAFMSGHGDMEIYGRERRKSEESEDKKASK